MGERFEIVQVDGGEDDGLFVVWDKDRQEVIDVLDQAEAEAYFPDDAQ